jgi:hypothetical protein
MIAGMMSSRYRGKIVKLIDHNSLAATLDMVNEALFYERPLSKSTRAQAAKWIAARQGMPGSYAEMFAPTERDFERGIVLFTGEKVSTRVGLSHILGQEACRTLILLDVAANDVKMALERASIGITSRMRQAVDHRAGMYCCAKCSCSVWRHLSVGGLEKGEQMLAMGMKELKRRRDGKGRWKAFPFYYTLLVLSEIELPLSVEEMRYTAPVCERYLRMAPKKDKISGRRRRLVKRILENC